MSKYLRFVIFALTSARLSPAQSTGLDVLEIDLNNVVFYVNDVTEFSRLSGIPGVATAVPARNFSTLTQIGDIVAVNGRPAKGVWTGRWRPNVNLTPTPGPGQAQADVTRSAMADLVLEIQQADGTPVGSIMYSGMFGGPPPPGAPSGVPSGNFTILGGTGAFLGVQGQTGNVQFLPDGRGGRTTSVTEDPANRRKNEGGGSWRLTLQLKPIARPVIATTAQGPAIAHKDGTLVSTSSPAGPGEVLTLYCFDLGPTEPALDPGQLFSAPARFLANSPISVIVDKTEAQVLYVGGYPGTSNGYQVNFQLPLIPSPGPARLQISAAWIRSDEVSVVIR